MSTTTKPSLRIASYNVRAGLGTDLRRDPSRNLAVIAALAPDLIAVQEADFRTGHRPTALPRAQITAMTDLHPLPLHGHPDSLGWHGIAVLVQPHLQVRDVDCIDLPGLEPRGAIIADLTGPFGPLRVAAVHLGLLRASRRRQLDHLRNALAARAPCPTIILGDFNEWRMRIGLGRIARDFKIVTPGRSFPSRRPLLALDRIAHSPDLIADPLPLPAMPAGPHPSDHLPILARLSRAESYSNGYIQTR